MDDLEEIRKKRAIKVILTDIFMALSVIGIVFILVMAVAGWRINSDFTFEQNGLVSIKTKPTSASVIIDGLTDFSTTNMSKMLPGGEHKIELEKEGYERWEKTIKVTPGWLTRLEYPRLFKQNREQNTIETFESLRFFYVSPDRSTAILSTKNSTEWTVVTDFNSTPKFKSFDIRGIFNGTDDGTFNYKIESLEWSNNDEKILLRVTGSYDNDGANIGVDEWGILDLKDIKNSINLSSDYSRYEANSNAILATSKKSKTKKITSAKFENEVGDKVIAVVENNLVRLDTTSKVLSNDLADHVEDFALYNSMVIYKTVFEEGKSYLKFLRLGEKNPSIVAVISDENTKTSFALTKFNSQSYLLYTINNHLYVYRSKEFPTGGGNKLSMKNIIDKEIGIIASEAKTSLNNEFISLREGSRVIIFDAELEEYHEFDYGDEQVRFLDNYLLYRVDKASGKFLVWDFDSTNVRTLVVDRGINAFDALISGNDRFFYYIAKDYNKETDKTTYSLIQEKLV
ncbi:PEGA domain-containing protein [Candidatus Saccharibacteria bacterium]|nr:PEGA domain-containing protein [Candidatus Saccharibacteria bacterium]